MANTEYSIPTNYRTLYEKFIRLPQALKYSLENIDIIYRLSIIGTIYTYDDFDFEIENALENAFYDMRLQTLSKSVRKKFFLFLGSNWESREKRTSLFVNQLLFPVAPAFALKSYNLSEEDLEKYLSTIKDVQWKSEYKKRSPF